jgi:hypothetical protein
MDARTNESPAAVSVGNAVWATQFRPNVADRRKPDLWSAVALGWLLAGRALQLVHRITEE